MSYPSVGNGVVETVEVMAPALGPYSAERAAALGKLELDRRALAARGQPYERLDQLTVELLLGAR